MKRLFPVLGALLSTVAIMLIAADKPTICPTSAEKPSPKMIQKTYAIADLIVPVPDCSSAVEKEHPICPAGCCMSMACCPHVPSAPTTHEALIKLITSTVSPHCWAVAGGCCAVDYYPIGMGLVISAPADVQEQVADLLAALRHLQDVEVAVELRLVTVGNLDLLKNFGVAATAPCCKSIKFCGAGQEGCIYYGRAVPAPLAPAVAGAHDCLAEACGECCPHCEKLTVMPRAETPPCTYLTDRQVFQFLEAVQGDQRANIMCAPKITMFNGQSSRIQCLDQPMYLTGVDFTEVNGQAVVKPINKALALGFQFDLHSTVSADRESVLLDVHMQNHSLVSETVPLVSVTYFVLPQQADGRDGPCIPFTQFIQQPRVNHLDVSVSKNIPSGQSMLVYCGQQEHETRWESGPPILSRIPYVNRLFKKVGCGTETQHVLLLITPRVIVSCEAEEKACPGKCCEKDCKCCDKCCKQKVEVSHEKDCCGKDCKCCDKCCKEKAGAASKECKCCGKECKCCDKCCEKKPVACDAAVPAPCTTVLVRVADPRVMSPQQQRIEKMALKAMENYHAAVRAGDLEKARELAMEALDLDPACFHKQMAGSAAAYPMPAPFYTGWVPVIAGAGVPPNAIAVQFPDGTVHSAPGCGPIPPPPAAAGGVRYLTAPIAAPVPVPLQPAMPAPIFWDAPGAGPRYWPEPSMPARVAPPVYGVPAPPVPIVAPPAVAPPCPAPLVPTPTGYYPAGMVPPPPIAQILPTPTMGACLQALSPTGGYAGITPAAGAEVPTPPISSPGSNLQAFEPNGWVTGITPAAGVNFPLPLNSETGPSKSRGWFWNTRLGRWIQHQGNFAVGEDPNTRMNQLLNQSEDMRQIREEWQRIWFSDQPSNLCPQRVQKPNP
ncbi:MAG TPA: hypothetical protein VKS79_24970 [Gemmataceae bacterium]|nr:hypothetical protein [Gemmataceae bacterium]